jgi:hypothetical protein
MEQRQPPEQATEGMKQHGAGDGERGWSRDLRGESERSALTGCTEASAASSLRAIAGSLSMFHYQGWTTPSKKCSVRMLSWCRRPSPA